MSMGDISKSLTIGMYPEFIVTVQGGLEMMGHVI